MTFRGDHRYKGVHTEQECIKISWFGEIFGTAMYEELAEMYPDHADALTAIATMEWFNTHWLEPFAHEHGVQYSLEAVEKVAREGTEFARHLRKFEDGAKVMDVETGEAVEVFKKLTERADSPELKALGEEFQVHEPLIRDCLKSEIAGTTDGIENVFAYLERHGITRQEAVIPRKLREDLGGDNQQLVLAFFDTEDAADDAAKSLKSWEKASEFMKEDAIGIIAKDTDGSIKEHKLGRRAGKKGMGVGVVLGLIAAIPTAGLSLVGGAVAGTIGGGVIGDFFHKGLKMTDEDVARVDRELSAGHAAVGVLAWDFEADAVAAKLKDLGGTPETHQLASVTQKVQ
jgi:uncharacterized membrane protein